MNKKYWFSKITNDDKFDYAIKNNVWLMQQQYNKQNNSAVTIMWSSIKDMNVGDYLMLGYGNTIHAIGKICKPRNIQDDVDTHEIYSLQETLNNNEHKYSKGLITYDDSDVFYEDFNTFGGKWAQRIDVEEWIFFREDGISNNGIQKGSINNLTTHTIFEIKKDYFNEKQNNLKDYYMESRDI